MTRDQKSNNSRNADDASDKENKNKKYQDGHRSRERKRNSNSQSSASSNSSSRSSSSDSRSSSGSSSNSSSSSSSRSSSSSSASSHHADVPSASPKLKNKPVNVTKSPERRYSRRDEDKKRKHDSRQDNSRLSNRNEYGVEHRGKSPPLKRSRRKATPSPKPPRICISKLTVNIIKDHLVEIFSNYGTIKDVEMPLIKTYNGICNKGYAYIEFETQEAAEKSLRMDGGQIDGYEVFCELADYNHVATEVRKVRTPPLRNNYYPRGSGWRRPPQRYHQRRMWSPFPPRRWSPPPRQPRRRSRSPPVRHRRYSRSSSSNSR